MFTESQIQMFYSNDFGTILVQKAMKSTIYYLLISVTINGSIIELQYRYHNSKIQDNSFRSATLELCEYLIARNNKDSMPELI